MVKQNAKVLINLILQVKSSKLTWDEQNKQQKTHHKRIED